MEEEISKQIKIKKTSLKVNSLINSIGEDIQSGQIFENLDFSIKKCQNPNEVISNLGQILSNQNQLKQLKIKIGSNLFLGNKGFSLLFQSFNYLSSLEIFSLIVKKGNHLGQNQFSSIRYGLNYLCNLKILNLDIDLNNNIIQTDIDQNNIWFVELINLRSLSFTFKNIYGNLNLLTHFYKGFVNLVNLEGYSLTLIDCQLPDYSGFEILGKELSSLRKLQSLKLKTKKLNLYYDDFQNVFFEEQVVKQFEKFYNSNKRFYCGFQCSLQNIQQVQLLDLSLCMNIRDISFDFLMNQLQDLSNLQKLKLNLDIELSQPSQITKKLKEFKMITDLKILNSYQYLTMSDFVEAINELDELNNLKSFSITSVLLNFSEIEKERFSKFTNIISRLDDFQINTALGQSIFDFLDKIVNLSKLNFKILNENNQELLHKKMMIKPHLKSIILFLEDYQNKDGQLIPFFESFEESNKVEILEINFSRNLKINNYQNSQFQMFLSSFRFLKSLKILNSFELTEKINSFNLGFKSLQNLERLELNIYEDSLCEISSISLFESLKYLILLKDLVITIDPGNLINDCGMETLCKSLQQLQFIKKLKITILQQSISEVYLRSIIEIVQNWRFLKKLMLRIPQIQVSRENVFGYFDILKTIKSLEILFLVCNSLATPYLLNLFHELPQLKKLEEKYFISSIEKKGSNRKNLEINQQLQMNNQESDHFKIDNTFDIQKMVVGIYSLRILDNQQLEEFLGILSKIKLPTFIDSFISFDINTPLHYSLRVMSYFKKLDEIRVLFLKVSKQISENISFKNYILKMKRLVKFRL